MKNIFCRISIITLLCFKSFVAFAGTATGTLTVQATVVTNCTVSSGTVNFGNVDTVTLASGAINGSGTFTTTCSNGASYTVGLGNGANYATGTRNMKSSGNGSLPYALYQDSARQQPWGNSGSQLFSATGTGTSQTNTVYGSVTQGSYTLSTGAYSDSVTITVTF